MSLTSSALEVTSSHVAVFGRSHFIIDVLQFQRTLTYMAVLVQVARWAPTTTASGPGEYLLVEPDLSRTRP